MTAECNDNGNGKVTLALLGHKVDALTKTLEDFIKEERVYHQANDDRVHDLEKVQARQDERIENLKAQAKFWLSAEGVAAVFAMFVALFKVGGGK